MIPEDVMTRFFQQKIPSYLEFWTFRKQVTMQLAAISFMTYIFSIGHRHPSRFHISCQTGKVWASDLMPSNLFNAAISNSTFLFTNNEAVPFRLTPNFQHFITDVGMEGVFSTALMSIGRALVEPVNEIHDYLGIFVRDELVTWQQNGRKPPLPQEQLSEYVLQNVDLIIKRCQGVACLAERDQPDRLEPLNQTILDLISQAVNPLKLAQMDIAFLPQL